MRNVFSFSKGELPLLVSIPHDGRELASGQAERMTAAAQALPDTDWHVRRLYTFAGNMGANVIAANYSRYVVDLNRSADDAVLYEGQVSTGLFPSRTFAGENIYESGGRVSADERRQRVNYFWRPYHEHIAAMLAAIRDRFGYALLWDAHSIASEVPLLFPGVLPDLNLGTDGGKSCAASVAESVMSKTNGAEYSAVLNGRFRGGYITRHYGLPERNIHAIQLELSQRNYMDEKDLRYDAERASKLAVAVENMMMAFVSSAQDLYQNENLAKGQE